MIFTTIINFIIIYLLYKKRKEAIYYSIYLALNAILILFLLLFPAFIMLPTIGGRPPYELLIIITSSFILMISFYNYKKIKLIEFNKSLKIFNYLIIFILTILLILFIIIIPYLYTPTTPPPDSFLGNFLKSIRACESKETPIFEIKSNQEFSSTIFADKGIDPCSVYFDAKDFSLNSVIKIEAENGSGECVSNFKNITNVPVRMRAQIMCESNLEKLQSLVTETLELELEKYPNDFWKEEPGFSKVCVVVFKRA